MNLEIRDMLGDIERFERNKTKKTRSIEKAWDLFSQLLKHYSIDTLAKKFWLADDIESLKRIKNLISSLIHL